MAESEKVPWDPLEEDDQCIHDKQIKKKSDAKILLLLRKADPTVLEKIKDIQQSNEKELKTDIELRWQLIADTIYIDLQTEGQLYKTENGQNVRCFWFDNILKVLYDIKSEHFKCYFCWRYDLSWVTTKGKYIFERIYERCANEGFKTNVYRFSFYDVNNNILYKFNNNNKIFKLDGEKIDIIDNGQERILFEKEYDAEPIEPVYTEDDYLSSCLFDNINFESDQLDYIEQHYLFQKWFFSIFFPELFETKPLCLLWGEKGSGKTSLFQRIKKVLSGKKGNVESINKKEESFIALVTHEHFVALDNVDEYIPWLSDMLAKCSTGQRISMRVLYKTNELITFYPRVFIGLTARMPHFRRDDVADRLLIFKVKRFDQFKPQSELVNEIYDHRKEIWGDILTRLNDIIRLLKKNKDTVLSRFRLADFYNFCRRQENDSERLNFIFDKMSSAQSDYILEYEPILQVLNIYMNGKNEEILTTGQWYKKLAETAEKENLTWYKSARSFGMKIKNLISELRQYYDIELFEGKHGREKHMIVRNKNIGETW